jgi:hypothetical protein
MSHDALPGPLLEILPHGPIGGDHLLGEQLPGWSAGVEAKSSECSISCSVPRSTRTWPLAGRVLAERVQEIGGFGAVAVHAPRKRSAKASTYGKGGRSIASIALREERVARCSYG